MLFNGTRKGITFEVTAWDNKKYTRNYVQLQFPYRRSESRSHRPFTFRLLGIEKFPTCCSNIRKRHLLSTIEDRDVQTLCSLLKLLDWRRNEAAREADPAIDAIKLVRLRKLKTRNSVGTELLHIFQNFPVYENSLFVCSNAFTIFSFFFFSKYFTHASEIYTIYTVSRAIYTNFIISRNSYPLCSFKNMCKKVPHVFDRSIVLFQIFIKALLT